MTWGPEHFFPYPASRIYSLLRSTLKCLCIYIFIFILRWTSAYIRMYTQRGGGGTNLAPVGGCLGFLFPISGSAGRTRPLHELRDLHNEKSM